MVPLHNLLKYTFRQEEMNTDEHKHLLTLLKLHNDKPYCDSLIKRGLISDCDAAKKAVVKEIKRVDAGHPVQGDKGENVECGEWGILTDVCGAGADPTCNGSYTYGQCE
jgi:hypothetical protein